MTQTVSPELAEMVGGIDVFASNADLLVQWKQDDECFHLSTCELSQKEGDWKYGREAPAGYGPCPKCHPAEE